MTTIYGRLLVSDVRRPNVQSAYRAYCTLTKQVNVLRSTDQRIRGYFLTRCAIYCKSTFYLLTYLLTRNCRTLLPVRQFRLTRWQHFSESLRDIASSNSLNKGFYLAYLVSWPPSWKYEQVAANKKNNSNNDTTSSRSNDEISFWSKTWPTGRCALFSTFYSRNCTSLKYCIEYADHFPLHSIVTVYCCLTQVMICRRSKMQNIDIVILN